MKHMMLNCLTIAFAAVALATTSIAEDHGHHEEEQAPLGKTMEDMGGAFKKLSRAMRAPDAANLADYQAQAAVITKSAVAARDLVPVLAKEAGDGKDAMVASYQKNMAEFVATAKKLEKALAAGDLAAAKELVGKLNAARKQGHKDFKKPEED